MEFGADFEEKLGKVILVEFHQKQDVARKWANRYLVFGLSKNEVEGVCQGVMDSGNKNCFWLFLSTAVKEAGGMVFEVSNDTNYISVGGGPDLK